MARIHHKSLNSQVTSSYCILTLCHVGEDGSIFVHVIFKGENAAYATAVDAIDIYGADSSDRLYNNDVLFVSSEDIEEHVHEVRGHCNSILSLEYCITIYIII